ncbi:MAG: DUF3526 domain-containing protein [Chitinophagaceae bacterium]|nr:DUF3526 domain-containing protein [Chitinophagaceae bacterium]
MLIKIIQHEWKQWLRDKRIVCLLGSMLLLGTVAIIIQVHSYKKLFIERTNAQQASRQAWLSQGEKHPHMAAHFGNYAYKQPSILHCFDAGLTIYTGTSIYLEPHRQNDFLFSQIQEKDTGARFGHFGPSMVCQLIIPLLIILLTFNTVNGEKQRGTYLLLLGQGVTLKQILFGKVSAVFLFFTMFLIAYISAIVIIFSLVFKNAIELSIFPFFYLWLVYTGYYLLWSLLGVAVSASVKNIGSAISVLLLFWIVTYIIVPKTAANLAENIYPLTTNYAFKKQIINDIENGLDGHDPSSKRAQNIADSLLKIYNVGKVDKLPFNFEGYIMQQGEEYSSKVYNHHLNSIFNTLKRQRNIQSWASLLSPFIAVRHLSMAACNSSIETEIDFQQQAENYRLQFVRKMNDDMKNNSAYGDWDNYKIKNEVYNEVKDFVPITESFIWRIKFVAKENLFLLAWLLFLITYLLLISKKEISSKF